MPGWSAARRVRILGVDYFSNCVHVQLEMYVSKQLQHKLLMWSWLLMWI